MNADLDEKPAAGVAPPAVEVIVGYLVTHPDGYAALIKGDRTRAENYAITHHAVAIEPAYVRRLG